VVLVGLTTSVVPEPTCVPPQLPLYQSTVSPAPTDAVSVDDPPTEIEVGFAAGLVGAASEFTVTVTEDPQLALMHPVLVFRARG
jgi:hypothetical protein